MEFRDSDFDILIWKILELWVFVVATHAMIYALAWSWSLAC